jgi:hypothetical protein
MWHILYTLGIKVTKPSGRTPDYQDFFQRELEKIRQKKTEFLYFTD